MPGGVNSPVRALKDVGVSPLFIKKAKGPLIIDVDNNKYIDYCMSWGVCIMGHVPKCIVKGIRKAVKKGITYGIPSPQETVLAKIICEHVPSIEKIRFVNSGTEAVMSSIRLARAYTKRNKIIKFDGCYHGHADHLLVAAGSGVAQLRLASSAGIPDEFLSHTISLPYNDIDALIQVFDHFGNEIAAVIVEPVAANMGVVVPDIKFLNKIRELTIQHGSLLIFDEVITGFRIGLGGAQKYFGVIPDLTTLGKIIGGGMPVGAYGGRADIMALVAPDGPMYQAGTLSGNPVAMAAGIETLRCLENPNFYCSLEKKSNYFFEHLGNIIHKAGIRLNTLGSMFTIFFSDKEICNLEDVKRCNIHRFNLFFNKLLNNGIYISPSQFEACFLSSSHTEKDLNKTLEIIEKVIKQL